MLRLQELLHPRQKPSQNQAWLAEFSNPRQGTIIIHTQVGFPMAMNTRQRLYTITKTTRRNCVKLMPPFGSTKCAEHTILNQTVVMLRRM